MASILRGFALAFAIELVVLAVIRATWNPSRDTLFILWVAVGCAVVGLVAMQVDARMRTGRWSAIALIVLPVLLFAATWLLFGFSYYLECGGAASPFFDLSCN